MYVCVNVCICICMHVYTYIYIYVCVCVCVCMYVPGEWEYYCTKKQIPIRRVQGHKITIFSNKALMIIIIINIKLMKTISRK
jgi:hypothetical protein